jgi:predicted CoA-substrate-specific enzyme activase
MDRNKRVIARRYLMTAGRPIEAVRSGLLEIGNEIGNRVVIKGVTTTGSGRYLIGDFIGADFVKNEITAHARGAVSINPEVDTVFEIGGQDSKYIRLDKGAVVDFTMNKVCAAGTGSFLEEQAEKLGINIKEEFGTLALSSKAPVGLGERCTVFMESSLNHYQQLGLPKQDLVAGLSYSIVLNYLNRVVEDRRIGDVVFFQGGTAYNRGVKAAFEKVCGKKVTVPAHHDVLGAIGSALIALENTADGPSRFKGFDLAKRSYTVKSFECTDCPNNCEIRRVSIENEIPLHYGSRCGKFDEEKRESLGRHLPRLFAEREKILLNDYSPERPIPDKAPTIGIPRTTLFFEMYPFWNVFFSELGFHVVTSPPTNQKIINRGCEAVVEEICFPIKVAHGHVLELLDRRVDYLMLPCVINMEHLCQEVETSYNCPYVQSLPYVVSAAVDFKKYQTKVLKPVIHMEWGAGVLEPQLRELARDVGCSGSVIDKAINKAFNALNRFRKKLVQRGRQVLENLPQGTPSIVLVSRPYNGCDPGLNFRIPDKLRDMGVLAIPLDFLPVNGGCGPEMKTMYWRYGQRILSAARTIAQNPDLHALYLTNFGCGPDSFIIKYFNREMKGKPFLTIEVDEHSADAGVITRLEAFLDSLQTARLTPEEPHPQPVHRPGAGLSGNLRKVYIPYMDDHGLAIAAAMRNNNIAAEALPMSDEVTVEIGRRYTSGKECYPCILTTGDIVKKAISDDFDPERASFFMPSAMGPCRFGQYNRFQRFVLDDLGYKDVPMIVLDQTIECKDSFGNFGDGFRLLAWQSVIMVDYLKKLLLQTRPYEKQKGDSDTLYSECLERVVQTVGQQGTVGDLGKYAARRFASIPVDRREPRPLIGIVGEIFVRSHQFSNNFFIRRIEELGGEAVMPTLQEWIEYTDWERKKNFRRQSNYRAYMSEVTKSLVQSYHVRKISRPFKGTVNHFLREIPTEEVMNLSSEYLHEEIRGEATLSMGRAVEYARHGFNGVVNIIPFNCLPGTIVNSLLCRFSQDYPQVPVLKMVYDGTIQSGDQTRIEAFMYQARQVIESSNGGKRG